MENRYMNIHPLPTRVLFVRAAELLRPNPADATWETGYLLERSRGPALSRGPTHRGRQPLTRNPHRHKENMLTWHRERPETHSCEAPGAPSQCRSHTQSRQELNLSHGNTSSVLSVHQLLPSLMITHSVMFIALSLFNCCNLVSFNSLHPRFYLHLETVMQE